MMLAKMLPSFATTDAGNLGRANAISLSKGNPRFMRRTNSKHIAVGQFTRGRVFTFQQTEGRHLMQTVHISMFHVLASGAIFQIAGSIIQFVTVLVVYIQPWWTWPQKCFGYKCVNVGRLSVDIDEPISVCTETRTQNASYSNPPTWAVSPYTPQGGYAISGTSRHRHPRFNGSCHLCRIPQLPIGVQI